MIGLIDGDAIFYVVGYNYKDVGIEATAEVRRSVTTMVRDMLLLCQCDNYYGAISDIEKCFRTEFYKYRRYKGNRPPKPDWFNLWYPTMKLQLEELGFVQIPYLEADDIIASLAVELGPASCIIMSPDKDLMQIPGVHFDYKKGADAQMIVVPEPTANYNFWLSMLEGDDADNIAGVPGLGVKKGKALLDAAEPVQYKSVVLGAYCKYFDSYYGNIIFEQTFNTLMMLRPQHAHWDVRAELEMRKVVNTGLNKSVFPILDNNTAQAAAAIFNQE